MADDTVEVRITAQTADLQSGMQAASASVKTATDGMKVSAADMAKALQAAGGDLSKITPAMLGMESAAVSAASGAGKVAAEAEAMAPKLATAAHSSSILTRELLVLGREGARGNFSRMAGSFTILATQGFGVSTSMLAAMGAVAGLAGGLAYLAIRASEAQNAIGSILVGARFAGNMNLAENQVQSLIDELQELSGASTSNAEKVIGAFARIPHESTPALQGMAAEVGDFAQSMGLSLEKASEAFVKLFGSENTSAEDLRKILPNLSQAQIDAIVHAERYGEANVAMALKIQAVNAVVASGRAQMDKNNTSLMASIGNWITYAAGVEAGKTVDQQETEALAAQNVERQKQAALIKKSADELKATPLTAQQKLDIALSAAESVDTKGTQIDVLKGKIAEIKSELVDLKAAGDTVNVQKLNDGLAAANERLKELTKPARTSTPSLLPQFQEQLAQMRAASDGNRTHELAATQAFWQRILDTESLSAKDRLSVERNLANATAALKREQIATAATIARQDADTDLAIAKTGLEAKKSLLQERLAAGKITGQQEVMDLKQVTEQEYQLDLQRLQDELSTLTPLTAEYDRVYNEIRKLKAQHIAQMAALDRQAADAAKRVHDRSVAEWKQTLSPITRAFDTSIQGMVMGTQTLRQAMARMGASIVAEQIASDARGLANFAATKLAELTIQKTTDAAKVASNTAAAAATSAADSAAAKQGVIKHAYSAAAAVYDDVAQIPYVGWLLAPPAAASAFAAVAAFGSGIPSAEGGWVVPSGMNPMTQLHENEMVLPAGISQGMQSLINGGEGPGGATQVVVNYNVSAMDGQSVARVLKQHGGVIANVITSQIRNLNLKPAPGTA